MEGELLRMRRGGSDVQANESDAMSLDGACAEEIEGEGRLSACERGALIKFLSAGREAAERKTGPGKSGSMISREPRWLEDLLVIVGTTAE